MLKIEGLSAEIDGKPILNGIDLEVPTGELHAVMGPNGSGKSTLSYVLAGREGYEVTGGSVTFDGQDLLAMEPEERAAAQGRWAPGKRPRRPSKRWRKPSAPFCCIAVMPRPARRRTPTLPAPSPAPDRRSSRCAR